MDLRGPPTEMLYSFPMKQLILFGGDILLIVASFYFAPVLRFGLFLDPRGVFEPTDGVAILSVLLCYYIFDFYNTKEKPFSVGYFLRFATTIIVAVLFVVVVYYIFSIRPYAAEIMLLIALLIFVLGMGWRILLLSLFRQVGKVARILIIGAGKAGDELCRLLSRRDDYAVVGLLDDDHKKWGGQVWGANVIGSTEKMHSLLDRADMVIVAITHGMSKELYKRLIDAKMRGCELHLMPDFCESVFGKVPISHISDPWLVSAPISGVAKNL